MRLKIQLFAAARELAGEPWVELDLPLNCSVRELRERLAEQQPALRRLLDRCSVAVDEEFADDKLMLKADQRVALIPPVSGGQ